MIVVSDPRVATLKFSALSSKVWLLNVHTGFLWRIRAADTRPRVAT